MGHGGYFSVTRLYTAGGMYVSYDTLSVFWAVQPGLIFCDIWKRVSQRHLAWHLDFEQREDFTLNSSR